ncbi:hypothetical protein FAGAP_4218 [Fusarium agapanthi]|uniref:Uncharacterized protein n=1 Tax=Fusarium agapanthi TaxID=1803897 RepID=A0A9P5BDU7_9HYPO|nr:hypothetical protein FAGAP_4218 [Fusarium agapanthi]
MSSKDSEKNDMAAEKPSKQAGEMLSKNSVEKPDMTGQVVKTLGTEVAQDRTKEVNGRRFTFRFRDSNGLLLPTDKRWVDEDGKSMEWWEKKSLLRDWIYGRMSPGEFDNRFPHYMGPPKEWYRIEKETHAIPQQEKEPSEPKESDEICTQRYAEYYGDGSGLPFRPGMGPPTTDEQFQEWWKEKLLIRDWVHGRMSAEEFDSHFPNYDGPKYGFSGEKEEASDVRSSHSDEFDEDCTEEEFHCMVQDDTQKMLCDEYNACLRGDDGDLLPQPSMGPSKTEGGLEEKQMKEDDKEKPRYAQHYGDGSGLPLRPGMGPPMTEEEKEESLKKWQAESERLWNMTDEELFAQYPEYEAIKGHHFAEGEAEEWLEQEDKENPIYASYYGDGSGLPLRPGMGPPPTEEEDEELLKKLRAEYDEIFNMSKEEFNAEFPEYKDMPIYFCTDHESWRIMEECDEAEARNHLEGKE